MPHHSLAIEEIGATKWVAGAERERERERERGSICANTNKATIVAMRERISFLFTLWYQLSWVKKRYFGCWKHPHFTGSSFLRVCVCVLSLSHLAAHRVSQGRQGSISLTQLHQCNEWSKSLSKAIRLTLSRGRKQVQAVIEVTEAKNLALELESEIKTWFLQMNLSNGEWEKEEIPSEFTFSPLLILIHISSSSSCTSQYTLHTASPRGSNGDEGSIQMKRERVTLWPLLLKWVATSKWIAGPALGLTRE